MNFCSNAIHVDGPQLIISLSSGSKNDLLHELKTLEHWKQSRESGVFATLDPKLMLKFIKVDSTAVLNNSTDKWNICWVEVCDGAQ